MQTVLNHGVANPFAAWCRAVGDAQPGIFQRWTSRAPKPSGPDVAKLFDAHSAFIHRTVERMTGPGAHVDDLVQETFLTAHLKAPSLPQDTQWRAWLFRVAMHAIQHHRRSHARRQRLQESLTVEPGEKRLDPSQALERRTNSQMVRNAILEIPLTQRDVFVLFELEELPGQEIAQLLDIPENTVWSRLRIARAAFGEALQRLRQEDGSVS